MANSTVCQSKWKPIVEQRRAKPKTYRQAPTHWLKFYEEAVIESEAGTAVVQLKSEPALFPNKSYDLYNDIEAVLKEPQSHNIAYQWHQEEDQTNYDEQDTSHKQKK